MDSREGTCRGSLNDLHTPNLLVKGSPRVGREVSPSVSSARKALSSRSGSAHRTRPVARGVCVLVLRMACAAHHRIRHWGGWPLGLNPPSHPLTHAVREWQGRRHPWPPHALSPRVQIAIHYRKRSRTRATILQRGQGCSSPVRLLGTDSPAHRHPDRHPLPQAVEG